MNRTLFVLLAVLAVSGCAHLEAAPGEVTYGKDAKQDYDLGQEALKAGRHQDAVKYFEHVRAKYPYSAQAALADLAIGDADFDAEKYVEAIEDYKSFLKLHPNHPQADYAQYRIALSHYKDIPSDFFIFPPSTEKDQSSVREAGVAFEDFLKQYPNSSYAPEGQKLLSDVRKRLAQHEIYVADFYFHRAHYQAAVSRLTKLLEDYPKLGFDAQALLMMGQSYAKLGDKDRARETLQRLVKDFPEDKHRAEAEKLLKELS